MNTWWFDQAAVNAFLTLQEAHSTAVDAVVTGCSTCEELQCDHTVGYGGSPDENGETTLDAMIFDGTTMNMGAVGGLRRIKDAALAAKMVLQHTKHSFLVGDLATEFAKNFELHEENLSTNYSTNVWKEWKSRKCQPNFWQNVNPDPTKSCGPYQADSNEILADEPWKIFNSDNHDTIGMIAIDECGNVAAGTSTNGASHKIPGRVGDSPIPGAGAYADSTVGAAVATGDGDVMMRFLPSFLAVEEMRRGASPAKAAQTAIDRIAEKYPDFFGAVLVSTNKGEFGAACNGMDSFPFCVASEALGGVVVKTVNCTKKA
ncbi:Putative N(4)-(beta-N-acetylglucosaminyl)-L-asparaginase CG1827-like Protein [Tribolium castaneum]|uniref:N(4)-(beta-N-acetylglucosaminyl)-L-asparaginase n=2 Tax=Tribolium castaneum TaxID=7070 RepID=D2A367_TRICA|nr:Putative N(4)-(beta-N-acetylglucosaminyl)-L-asparaginase CG1827-like Protein [Tribolium castaneum]